MTITVEPFRGVTQAELRTPGGDLDERQLGSRSQDVKGLLRIALAGGLMTVLAYPLMLTVRRMRSMDGHARACAAVVGIAMLLGALLMIVLWLGARSSKRHWLRSRSRPGWE